MLTMWLLSVPTVLNNMFMMTSIQCFIMIRMIIQDVS
ncbi:hypothetical protein PAECIP111802_07307 [Paenibacillus allorhizosphaerae]|uniref:Uncharacterized protein n=1 Tax=Paenibacillus allorhizosphaerae TaxID=2849866 RepID=A0ABM8VUS2_9BACL|nr:hypothetical protein PAECIP111802_07307 [Paenibacillus allorhizosphaerae]